MRRASLVIVLTWIAASAALVGATPSPLATAAAQGQASAWGMRADMLVPRSEHSIAQMGDRIFTIGGYPGARVTSNSVQVYDARADTWAYGPPLPLSLHHTMAAAVDGRLYLIGGEFGDPLPGALAFRDGVYRLDEEARTWVPRAPMPTPRSGGGASVIDGKIYVVGGRPPHGHDFAVYDPAADAWTVLPDVPTQRNHLAMATIDGKLYVAGGRFGGGVGSEMTDVLEIYDPRTNAWTSGAPMLSPRAGIASVAGNGCLYVVGGEGNLDDPRGIFHQNEVYDPGTNTWRSLEPMPLPTHGLTGAAYLDGQVYIPGGATAWGVSGPDVATALQTYRTDLRCSSAVR